jgi:UDP:flavonoid glycosyltransferase YjiC (YdhE family)
MGPRVLALTSAGVGHVFPLVPTLWAARGAGASVVVGATGPAVEAAAHAGLPAVDLAPGGGDALAAIRASFLRRMPGADERGRFDLAMRMFAALADHVADAAVALGRALAPDVVLHTPLQPAGPLVAAVLGVPVVEHGFQLTGVARTQDLLGPHLAGAAARHGVAALRPTDLALDVCPPSMHPGGPRGRALGLRPYSGGRVLEADLVTRLLAPRTTTRPRVLVTLGTTEEHADALPVVLDALARRGADVLLAGHAATVPPGTRVLAQGWLPLDTVLPHVDALVHHGGAGSALAALAHGVPQVIVSGHADHAFNAAAVARRGAGRSAAPAPPATAPAPDALGDALEAVLHDPAVAAAAREVAAEMAALPGPTTVVPELLDDLTRRRPTTQEAA